MTLGYRELLDFHIAALQGHFIDEIVPAPHDAGVMIFSRRETEAMWNLLFVANAAAAEAHRATIAQAFAVRERRPTWYLPDASGAALSPDWTASGQNSWMVRPRGTAAHELPADLTLLPVKTPAQIRLFNRLYIDVYWESAPPPDVALPIDAEEPLSTSDGEFNVRHWLLYRARSPVAMLTTFTREGLCGVYNVGTDPQFTGRGYASHAILAVLAQLEAEGCQASFLLTECNPRLAPFYGRLGFSTIATGQFFVCSEKKG